MEFGPRRMEKSTRRSSEEHLRGANPPFPYGKDFPLTLCVGIEATRRCNFQCSHCFVDAGRSRPGEMDTAAMKNLLHHLAQNGVTTIGWSGGEPFLRRDLEELTRAGAECGLNFTLATNGFLAKPDRLAALADAGLKVIQISLDGPTASRAARLRRGPPGAFERAVRAAADSVSLGLTVHLCTLLSPETAEELEEMAAFARSLGVHGLRYTMWLPVGKAAGGCYDEAAWSKPEVGRFFAVFPLFRKPDFEVLIDCPTGPCPGRENFSCKAGPGTSYITSEGDVYPCTALMTPEYRLGNVRSNSVGELLFGTRMAGIRQTFASHVPSGRCASCPLRGSCRGGCPGRTIAVDGTLAGGLHEGALPACLYRLHHPTGEWIGEVAG
jgi:radical SAM protein with 4Fe4S-binding SPASM domain